VVIALQRALMLMQDLAGGNVIKGLIDRYPTPFQRPEILLRVHKTNQFLGTSLSPEAMAGYLRSLEMEVRSAGSELAVTPPALRVDIAREVDLMEEVARLVGYDQIPVTAPLVRTTGEKDNPIVRLSDLVREIMTGCGFTEVISYSFISPDSADILAAEEGSPLRSFVRLLNPLSQDQSVMRTSLFPGLFAALKNNLFHGEKDLRLFEWGKVFLSRGPDELPLEKHMLAGIMTGLSNPKEWFGEERAADFFDVKGAVEVLLKTMKVAPVRFGKMEEPVPGFDTDSCAAVSVAGGATDAGVRVACCDAQDPARTDRKSVV